MTRTCQRFLSCFLFVYLAVACLLPSCGKKGPPVPPEKKGTVLAPPAQLTYALINREATLSWTYDNGNQAEGDVDGFEVFMATKPLEGCEGCPFMFKSVGVVPMPKTTFVYTLDQDLHYYFRVQALGPDNNKSTVSDTLFIDFP